MYPRLKLAKDLLSDDGVIFISIDDNEVENLKKICDEVFGESNFIVNLIWKSKSGGANDSKYFAVDHEYIIAYGKYILYDIEKEADYGTFTTSVFLDGGTDAEYLPGCPVSPDPSAGHVQDDLQIGSRAGYDIV
jgi:hypothetical protein